MLTRRFRHLVALCGLVAFSTLTIYLVQNFDKSFDSLSHFTETWGQTGDTSKSKSDSGSQSQTEIPDLSRSNTQTFISYSSKEHDEVVLKSPHVRLGDNEVEFDLKAYGKPVHEIFSNSTKNGKYFTIVTGEYESYNPSILAHPEKNDTWILIAQQERTDTVNTVWFAQLVCEAKFNKAGTLLCARPPLILPIGVTAVGYDNCKGNIAWLSFNVGPHDARAFWGPDHPYALYGSQSQYNCFGIWIQDLRLLTDWGVVPASGHDYKNPFRGQTELQRPRPFGQVEKNWFTFWDKDGTMYAHYDMSPSRIFSKIEFDGSCGPDLAPKTIKEDAKCMARYLPPIPDGLESIHQATNSLSITLCKRHDPSCTPNDDNTYIMTIFHHKTFYNFHGEYHPYVMLFRRTAPFEIYSLSTKPLWVHGRGDALRPKELKPEDKYESTQMFYITSISWKQTGQKYHGYIDDVMFLSFGIEDSIGAAIDVVAEDVVAEMGLCSDTINDPDPEPAKNHDSFREYEEDDKKDGDKKEDEEKKEDEKKDEKEETKDEKQEDKKEDEKKEDEKEDKKEDKKEETTEEKKEDEKDKTDEKEKEKEKEKDDDSSSSSSKSEEKTD